MLLPLNTQNFSSFSTDQQSPAEGFKSMSNLILYPKIGQCKTQINIFEDTTFYLWLIRKLLPHFQGIDKLLLLGFLDAFKLDIIIDVLRGCHVKHRGRGSPRHATV